MNHSLIKNNKDALLKQKRLFGIILAVLVIAYNFIWLNRTFTMSEGWAFFYNGLIEEGKVPYRDFYYYLPPLNLLIDYIIWKVSAGYFFIYRLIRLAERVLLVEIMYSLISKKVDPFIASVGCFIGAVLASANVYDLVGDYNQTVQLFAALLCVLVLKYVSCFDDLKKRCRVMFLIGICGGCMFLSKQTIVVAAALVFMGFVLFLVVTKKEKNLFRMIISVALGLAVPLGITFVYLVYTRSLTEFITQVFIDTGSKGSLYDIIVDKFLSVVKYNGYEIISIISALAALIIHKKKSNNISSISNKNNVLEVILLCVSTGLMSLRYFLTVWDGVKVSARTLFIIPLIAVIAAIVFIDVKKLYGKIVVFAGFVVLGVMMLLNINNFTAVLYWSTGAFKTMTSLLNIVYLIELVWLFYHLINHIVKKTPLALDSVVLACTAIASCWSTVMSADGSGNVVTNSAFISVPVLIYLIFKNKRLTKQIYVKAFLVICAGVFCACACQKIENPYAWWGDSEASFSEKTEKSDIKALKGFRFSQEEYEKYDMLYQVIKDNTDENSTIFGFPYAKAYNVFLENYNMDNFVPVLFYDVCADDYAKKDAKLLAKNEPDIVIWHDIKYCMEIHEDAFRGGDILGQRQIQKWFADVKDKDYVLIGQVADVFVYKNKAAGKPTTKFIQRSNRKNDTADKKNVRSIENKLEGSGTKKNPYLISSVDDLRHFRSLVNDGNTFQGKYVKQTADIDLDSIENWRPIGLFSKDKYFVGTYDGAGYKISNLHAKQSGKEKRIALFGALAGHIRNVNLVNCDVSGTYAGGIAAYAATGSDIVNCVVSGKVSAQSRAAGIVEDTHGIVENCVSYCFVEAKDGDVGNITSYYTGTIKVSFSEGSNGISINDGKPIDADTCDTLNGNLDKAGHIDPATDLAEWSLDANKKLTINPIK